MSNFALIGAAGFVAPRHLQAVHEVGGCLLAAVDRSDSVGVLDRHFPQANFFTEIERFDRYLEKQRRQGPQVDYVSICSPNYLHDAHVRLALRTQAHAICEKPLVLNPWNIDGLAEIEKESGKRVHTILQLRLHPTIISLRKKIAESDPSEKFDVDLTYITSRGSWYFTSWKGDLEKSGGIATNIGVHFFDMLHFIFGKLQGVQVHHASERTMAGFLEYERARVRWFLSVDAESLPDSAREQGVPTFRSITVDDNELEFSGGFTDLHNESYRQILLGNGFGLEDNRCAIETVSTIRGLEPLGNVGDYHPFLKRLKA